MSHPVLPTENSGLRVFSACLLSALLIVMPFVQLAAASTQGSESRQSIKQETGANNQESGRRMAAENVFINAPVPAPAPALAPTIVATKSDNLAAVTTVAPGGTISYTVNIKNNGSTSPTDDALNVQFNDIINAHTTLVANSLVAAVSDTYNTIGNVQLSVAAPGLLSNDFDPDTGNNVGMTATVETKSSTACTGGCSNNVSISADGSFTYNPPVGFAGTDTFTYTAISGTKTATETVTITVADEIWFINNNAGACPGAPCDGRLTHPFQSLADFNTANTGATGKPGDNDWIFIYESATNYTGPATLRSGQKFIGQDATASLISLTGFTQPSGTDPLPAMNSGNGTIVNITGTNVNGINLNSGNTLRGFTVGGLGTGTKISGTSFGTLIVGNNASPDVTLNGTGQALNLSTGVLSLTGGFVSVATTSSAAQGINLAGVSDSGVGSFSFGSTNISGSTSQGINIGTTTADLNFGNTTVSSTGTAINISMPVAATNTITFGTTSATTTGAGTTAVSWTGVANTTLTFSSLGIERNNGTALSATGGGTVNVSTNAGSISSTNAGGPAIVASNIALNANFAAINSSGGANGVSLNSVTGTSNFGTGQLTGTVTGATFQVVGGTASVTYSGNITQGAAAAMVSITDHTTGTITFQSAGMGTGTLSATLGTGIQLDNTDGTYNFNGTTTLNGGDAGIDILDGSGGTITFGANTTITNPSGVAVRVDGGLPNGTNGFSAVTAGISLAGSISKTSGGRLIDIDTYDTGTATISATLSCTSSCDGIDVTNNGAGSGTVNFSGTTKTLNTGADTAVNLDNNDGGNINFTGGGLDIDTTTGVGFNAINGGTVTVTGSSNTINSVSAAALNVSSTTIGANDLTFERIDSGNNTAAADPASGIVLSTTGSSGGLIVTGTGTTDGSGGTIQSTTADAISLSSTSSVVLKNMVIGDNAAVHTESVSTTNNIGDDGISSTSVTPVAGDTYGLEIDNLKIARTAGGGIDGAGGGNIGLHVTNTEIINPGDAGTPSSTSSDEDAIGYGSGFAGNADQLTGTVLIENSTFAAFIDHGFQIENSGTGTANITITNVTMKNNDGLALCSGGPCEGSAIQVIADGSTVAGGTGPTINLTVRTLTVTNIDQDGIDAIADPGGNINVTVGDPANGATNGITFNCPNGDQVLRFNSGSPDSDDVASFNFNVRNVIVQQSPGTLVIFKAANQMTGKFINSTLDANDLGNVLASRGIEITADGDASGGANEAPSMNILIDNVTLNRIGGDGIQAFLTDVTNAASRLDLTVQNSNIGTNPANTAQTGLEIGKNNSLASEGIEIRNGVTTTANGQMYVHLSNNNIRNATSTSGSADGIDIDAEFLTTSHVTVANNDIFAAPGTTDYDLAVEVNTAFMCADFTGNTDSNDANSGADITNNGDAADFQIEGGSGSLAGNNPGTSPFNFTGTFTTGTCTMPNTPTGPFFAFNNQSNQQSDAATMQIASNLPAKVFASTEQLVSEASARAVAKQTSLLNQVANVLTHSAGQAHPLIALSAPVVIDSAASHHAAPAVKSHDARFDTAADAADHAAVAQLETANVKTSANAAAPAPMSGETIGPINFGTVPAGGSVTITFQVTVDNPPNLDLLNPARVENQGTVSGSNFASVLTDDPDFGGATDKTRTLIDLFDTTTTLVSDLNPSNDGDTVTFTATINETPAQTPNPTGTVDFINTNHGNAVICDNVPVSGGQAQCAVSNLTAGQTHDIRADYSGDGNFDGSQSNIVNQVVNACVINPVVTTTADSGAGSLRDALATVCSAPNNNITFNIPGADPGHVAGVYTITLLTELVIGKNVNITGPNSVANTDPITVSGNNVTRVFHLNPNRTATIRNLTIANGLANGASHPDNAGAGIFNEGDLTLINSTVSGNVATLFGGGIYSWASVGTATLKVVNSTINGNQVTDPSSTGGGVMINSATATLLNSTFSANTAVNGGGGVMVNFGATTITNCTITGNTATTGGGGVRADVSVSLRNTIVANSNAPDDIGGPFDTTNGFNLIEDPGAVVIAANNTTGQDPVLGPLANNGGPTQTHRLLTGSPALDAASDANLPADTFDLNGNTNTAEALPVDQRGQPRVVDNPNVANATNGVDIGAYEAPAPPSAPDLDAASDTGPSSTDNYTSDNTPTFTINGVQSGAFVELLADATVVASGTAVGTSIQLTSSMLSDNTYSFTARQTVGGGLSPTSTGLNVTIDTGNPGAPTIDLQAASDSGTSNSDDITNAATRTFDIGNTETGATVELLRDGNPITSTTGTGGTVVLSDSTAAVSGTTYAYTARQTDGGGNQASSAALNVLFDNVGPTVNMNSAAGNPTNASPIPVSVTFNESVTGFDASDIVAGNGTVTNFAGSGANYTFDLVPTAQGTVTADISSNVATDTAGNNNSAATQFSRTFDTDAPTADVTDVTPDPRNNAVSSITIVFSEAVTGFDLSDLTLTRDGSGNLLTGAQTLTSGDNITWTLGNLSGLTGTQGTYLLTVNATGSSITDNAGNGLAEDASDQWVVDTTAPTVTINKAGTQADPTSSSPINFTVVFSEAVTGFINTDVDTSTSTAGGPLSVVVTEIAPNDGTTYNVAVSGMNTDGNVIATVNMNAAADAAGNNSAASTSTDNIVAFVAQLDMRINDAKVAEPTSGSRNLVFTVSLSSPAISATSVNFTTVDGTAKDGVGEGNQDYTPTNGTVNFEAGQQVQTIHVPVLADADNAEVDENLTVTLSSPSSNANVVDGIGQGTITVANVAGTLLISEFRQFGPGPTNDPLDDFVEIYNNTDAPITVPAGGYGLFKMGAVCDAGVGQNDTPILIGIIPQGTVIPARGHFLFTGPGANYSLEDYGGTNAAAFDALLTADLGANENFGLFATTDITQMSSHNRFDAVGFGINNQGACDLLREGSTLLPLTTNLTLLGQHSFFRKMCDWQPGSGCTVPGIPKDSNSNTDDFWFADTEATSTEGGERLGAPGPEKNGSPIRRDNSGISMVLLDGTKGSSASPNRERNGTPGAPPVSFGTMTLRYRVTNNTGGNVNRLRYRIVDISTMNAPSGQADLRALTGPDEAAVGPVNDPVTCSPSGIPCTVLVRGTTLEQPPTQTKGGGYNSTLSSGTITTGTPLTPGAHLLINFKLGVEQTGAFRFYIIIEALP